MRPKCRPEKLATQWTMVELEETSTLNNSVLAVINFRVGSGNDAYNVSDLNQTVNVL